MKNNIFIYLILCALLIGLLATIYYITELKSDFDNKVSLLEEMVSLKHTQVTTLEEDNDKLERKALLHAEEIQRLQDQYEDLEEDYLILKTQKDQALAENKFEQMISEDIEVLAKQLVNKDIPKIRAYLQKGYSDKTTDALLNSYLDKMFPYDYYEIFKNSRYDYYYIIKDGAGNELSFVEIDGKFSSILTHINRVDNMIQSFCEALSNQDHDTMKRLMIVDDLAPTEEEVANIFTEYKKIFDLQDLDFIFVSAENHGFKYKLLGKKNGIEAVEYVHVTYDFDTTFLFLDHYRGENWEGEF